MHTPTFAFEILEIRNLFNADAEPTLAEADPSPANDVHAALPTSSDENNSDADDTVTLIYFDAGFTILTSFYSITSAAALVTSGALLYKKDYFGVFGMAAGSCLSFGCAALCLAGPFALWNNSANLTASIVAWSLATSGFIITIPIYTACWISKIRNRGSDDCHACV